jgi:hypothetical protein
MPYLGQQNISQVHLRHLYNPFVLELHCSDNVDEMVARSYRPQHL